MIYISDSNTKSAPNSVITAASMGTEIYAPAVMVNIYDNIISYQVYQKSAGFFEASCVSGSSSFCNWL